MSNTLLTISMITVKALQLFRNSNAFLKVINKEYQGYFGKQPLSIGSVLQIRKPIDPVTRTGATASPQNVVEQEIPLYINSLIGVDLAFTDTDLSLSIADFTNRFLAPSVNKLGGAVAAAIMAGVETGGTAATGGQQTGTNGVGGIPLVVNLTASGLNDGAAATISPVAATWLKAGARLSDVSCPMDERVVIMSPDTQANTVSSLAGLFNPQRNISTQYEKGMMGVDTLGYEKWLSDQTVITHTTGAYSTLPEVNGGSQTGSTITTHAFNGPLVVGDVISFTGVNFCNRVTQQDTGVLATFVVTAAVASSDTSVSIYPPLIPTGTAFATVTASPADSALLLSPIEASQVYRKNFVFHPTACTAAFIELPENEPGTVSKSESFDGFSLRMMHYYNGANMTGSWRMDTLFGSVWPRPEWACIVTDTTS